MLSFNLLYIFLPSERVLGITEGMENLGGMQWELFGTLILGWIVVYLIIWKGLHSSGKVTLAWDGKTCTDHANPCTYSFVSIFYHIDNGVVLAGEG